MKRSALVIALLGASLGSAWAQSSSPTVYGVIDAGVVSERGCGTGCSTRIDGGVASESRVGIRGAEQIGNGLTAIFTLEAGLQPDTGRSGPDGRLLVQYRAGILEAGLDDLPDLHRSLEATAAAAA